MNNNSFEAETVKVMSDAVNVMGFRNEYFCQSMLNQHRTIQQNFTRLCLKWIETCSKLDEWQYDGRNEASVMVSKKIMEDNPNGFYIPMI